MLVTGLIIDNAYGGGLASSFTVPKYEASIDTVQDIVDRKMEWGATHDAWIFSIILSEEGIKSKHINKSIGTFAIGEYITKEATEDLELMLENFYYEQCVVMLRKSSPYTAKLSELVGRLHQSGLMLAWETQGAKDYLIGRYNNHTVDLNRNFPDLDAITFEFERQGINHNNHLLRDLTRLAAPLEPETRAVMRWIMSIPFVLSAAIHGGDLVANYPYDESRSGAPVSEYSASPDDETFRNLALAYAEAHADMASPSRPGCHTTSSDESSTFNFGKQGGVTNGAAWYSLKGGMQDFNYLATNAFEVTLELGCEKYPDASKLENEWPTTSWFDDETSFGLYPHGLGEGQPRIYKRSLYEKVAKTLLEQKDNQKQ
ncbi:hypothetical protein MSG28_008929 [Choristoneura fumiferana]|uniref:Uncharacterized protein n=1 Tax=Choristoneura fumiferana TaxID=7141 RepID=A0ACC0J8R4_CHOFU|nr:hypothetical protein MSG28_008929 [Choristoneura fumiferana]